jgi:DNA replication protein DnaC
MLKHPTYDRLIALGLTGMARALEEQRSQPDVSALTFEERLALLVDREAAERHNKRLANRLKFAGLRHNAVVEDIDVKTTRGLDRALLQKLIAGDWIDRKLNLIIIGPTGIGKSFLACALGHKACRDDRSVLYQRMPRLLGALALARGDGRHVRLLRTLARVDLLILDDWGLAPLTPEQGHDFLEIVDDRHDRNSTIITSQLPVEHWHQTIPNPTIADAILDRLVHSAHRLQLDGPSMRKLKAAADPADLHASASAHAAESHPQAASTAPSAIVGAAPEPSPKPAKSARR